MTTKVITAVGETETFEVSVGLHQGSALSPFLFVLVMNVLSEEIRNEELWELLYAKDLVITAENEEDLHRSVGEWQASLERRGLKLRLKVSPKDIDVFEENDWQQAQEDTKLFEQKKYIVRFLHHSTTAINYLIMGNLLSYGVIYTDDGQTTKAPL
ncbi:uncharacterized protein LOC135223976 [Macrobrachium nipponense]|uniref:uncharacterized protein LOC135223976 n=1 Tax=Macrobrachium nipponense TaxID=159736 RepID=UPI0030C86F11